MLKTDRIFIAGHTGLVGSALVRKLSHLGYQNLISKTHDELELRDQAKVLGFFSKTSIDTVFLAAARVGGIKANEALSGQFLYDNLMISSNVIHAASEYGVKKLIYFGSSCVYPRECVQPMSESVILKGPVEPTSEGYAIAKIAGMKLCEHYRKQYKKDFISIIPANLYGPFDNFDPEASHVIPAMIRRFHVAKLEGATDVTIWGSGKPTRDFVFVDDLADAIPNIVSKYSEGEPLNLGSGVETSIGDLAMEAAKVVGYEGKIKFDLNKKDGSPRKILDSSRSKKLGWMPKTSLAEGLKLTYEWAKANSRLSHL